MSEARRQYELMQECLLGFKAHTMTLGDLIEHLPELIKEIPNPDAEWKAEAVGHWWTLEQIHGTAIDLGESRSMPASSRQTVDDAIEGLEKLVEQALSSNA